MRNNTIDILKGVAFILMVIQHLYHFNPYNYIMPNFVKICGSISRNIFILLVGLNLNLYKKKSKKKKYIKIILYSLIVTLITYLLLPSNKIIFFGVLHFIGFTHLVNDYIELNSIKVGLLGLFSYYLYNLRLKLSPSDNLLNLILGSYSYTREPLDIFPILKWTPIVSIGYLMGDLIKIKNVDLNKYTKILSNFGKNSLNYYLIHIIPLIFWYNKKYI